jgi:hypothetical protein
MICKVGAQPGSRKTHSVAKKTSSLDMVVHSCSPQLLGRPRWEDCKFEASLGNLARLYHKENKREREKERERERERERNKEKEKKEMRVGECSSVGFNSPPRKFS